MRMCASFGMTGPSWPGIAKSGSDISSPPESGAPLALVRPTKPSWSSSGWRSQTSIVMLIRRATR